MSRKKTTKKSTPRPPHKKRGRPKKADAVDWTPRFLEAVLNGLHVREASLFAGVDRGMPYRREKIDEAFKLAWEEASEIGEKALLFEASRRAYHGVEKPVYQGKKLVGHIREYSDTLIMFLLRSKNPTKYRDNAKFEHSGPGGGPIPLSHADARTVFNVPDAEFRQLSSSEKLRILQQSLDVPSSN